MKQTKFIVLLIAFFGLTSNIEAQSAKPQDDEKEKQELSRKVKQGMHLRETRQVQGSALTVQTNKYNHREAEIMDKLNTEGIPADFPVYKSEYSNEQYTILMNKWYVANPSLLKKDSSNEQK